VRVSHSSPAAGKTDEKETLRSQRDRTAQPIEDSDELGSHVHRWVSYLRDESDQLPKMSGLFVGIDLEYLTRRVVMIPLLQELLFVRDRVSLNQILKLGEVRRAQESAYHCACTSAKQRRKKEQLKPDRSDRTSTLHPSSAQY